jgi:hypothetical protein
VSLTTEEKLKIIENFKTKEGDTGSSDVQIALLTARINQLQEHLKTHKVTKLGAGCSNWWANAGITRNISNVKTRPAIKLLSSG